MKRGSLIVAILGVFFFIQTAQAGWTPAKRLTWSSGSQTPAIAVDSFNTIHVVWESGYSDLYYKRSTDGGATWSAAKRLTWTSSYSWCPAISIDSANGIHVVWEDYSPGSFAIFYLRSSDRGLTWSAAKRLTWGSDSRSPGIADLYNEVHIVWDDYGAGGQTDIYYKKSTTGGYSWSASKRLTWTSRFSEEPVLAIDSSGIIHLVWADYTPYVWSIYYKKSPDGGTTWSPNKILTWESYGACPAISTDSNDFVHIVWVKNINDNYEIFHRRSTDKGNTWSAAKRLTWTPGESWFPAMALDSNDGLHAVWDDDTPGTGEIYYTSSLDGGAMWGAAKRLTWTSGRSDNSVIAVDSSDNIYVVWDDDTPGHSEIYYQKFIKE